MKDVNNYFDLIFNLNNPLFYAIIITVLLIFIFYSFYRYIILPLNKKYLLEKRENELKQIKLMALFAELSPDPIIRINELGKIIHSNKAAEVLKNSNELIGRTIIDLIPEFDISIKESIIKEKEISFSYNINERHYQIFFRGNVNLNIAQLYFHDITERKEYEKKLKTSQKKLKALTSHLVNLLEEERNRIARELHDGIGQNLLFLKMKLNKIKSNIEDEKLKKEFADVSVHFDSTIKDLKDVIYELKPKILDEMGLKPALTLLCQKISAESNIEGKINFMGFDERLEPKFELIIYRIIQEILNNIVKHSKANQFIIQLLEQTTKYRIVVSDDGIGFNPKEIWNIKNNNMGFGILNMKERIENLNGFLKIESSPDFGTTLIFEFPRKAVNWKKSITK